MNPTISDKIEPAFLALSADLPKGILLNEQRVVGFIEVKLKTTALTTLSLSMTIDGLQMHFSPAIAIEVMNVIRVKWDRAFYDFRQAKVSTVDVSNNFWGKLIGRTLRTQLIDISKKMFANTPLNNKNYNPLTDNNLQATLQGLQQNTKKLNATFKSPSNIDSLELGDFKNVELGISLTAKQKIQFATTQGAIIVPERGQVAASIKFGGTAESLLEEDKRRIKKIQVYSERDVLLYSVNKLAEPQAGLAVMQLIDILPKGRVSLQQWLPLGFIQKASNVEEALKLLRLLLLLENIRPEALRKLIDSSKPTESDLVKGITKITIDDGLTGAFVEILKENCEPIGGVNICKLLNVE